MKYDEKQNRVLLLFLVEKNHIHLIYVEMDLYNVLAVISNLQ